MTRQLLITKRDEDAANEALSLIRKSDEEIKKQFHMLEAINSVIKLLEMGWMEALLIWLKKHWRVQLLP